jgi:hypothetical protein
MQFILNGIDGQYLREIMGAVKGKKPRGRSPLE